MAKTWIGVSGWNYKEWRGDFYPAELPIKRQLSHATHVFNSIEINGSFYSLLTPAAYRRMRDESPHPYVFALKGSRFITHNKKLRDAQTPLANYFASGPLVLGDKLGPIVWQLAGNTRFDAERVDEFLGLLPRDTVAASRLARQHDDRVKGRNFTRAVGRHRIRHALEVRNPTFFTPELVRIVRRHGIALVISDSADWPMTEEITAGYVYIRLHGSEKTYFSRYDQRALTHWADRIDRWQGGGEPADARRITDLQPPRREGRDVYVYFDNTAHGNAPRDALRLAEMLSRS